jgi:hypothetical protein
MPPLNRKPEPGSGHGGAVTAVVIASMMVATMFGMGFISTSWGMAYGAQLLPVAVGAACWCVLAVLIQVAVIFAWRGSPRVRRVALITVAVAFVGSAAACPAGWEAGERFPRVPRAG